jgi:hypothetical protein
VGAVSVGGVLGGSGTIAVAAVSTTGAIVSVTVSTTGPMRLGDDCEGEDVEGSDVGGDVPDSRESAGATTDST